MAESMLLHQPVCLLCCWHPFSCYLCVCSEDRWQGKFYHLLCSSGRTYCAWFCSVSRLCLWQGLWLGIICAMVVQILALLVMMLRTNWDKEVCIFVLSID
jgi:hypothetical protein